MEKEKNFVIGGTALLISPDKRMNANLYDCLTIKRIHPRACGCGGSLLEFEEESGKFCDAVFVPVLDFVYIYKNLKANINDFRL